jgi:hypothetical protein
MANFANLQWAVTDWGLQSIRPGAPYNYNIAANRLLERAGSGGGRFYDWPVHVIMKNWVDFESFMDAYLNAIETHKGKYPGEVDRKLMDETVEEARKRKAANAPRS